MAHLKGMAEISDYARRSESTIVKWISELGFPAKKLTERVWESDTDLIDKWRLQQLTGEAPEPEAEEKPKKKATRKAAKRKKS